MAERRSWRTISHSRIKAVHFSIESPEEIKQNAVVEVSNKNILQNELPVSGGCYDPNMGTTDTSWNCTHCRNKKPYCLGHFGYMHVKYPLLMPTMINVIIHYAKVVCLECGAFMLGKKRLTGIKRSKLLSAYVVMTRNKKKKNKELGKNVKINMTCPGCHAPHPHIVLDRDATSRHQVYVLINQIMYDEQGNETITRLHNHTLLEAFGRVSNETVEILGKPLSSHPRNLISNYIAIPPNTIRPDKKVISGNRSGNDDLTVMVKMIAEINIGLPDIIPDVIDTKLADRYSDLGQMYYNLHMSSADVNTSRRQQTITTNLNGINGRIPLKKGRMRKDLMGGRSFVMARSVISGDPRLPLHVIGVPFFICRKLYKEIVVGAHNYEEIMIYFKNGINRYPGCRRLIKSRTGVTHSVDLLNDDIVPEFGDRIHRDLIDGDKIAFGRQPSLWDLSIRCFDVMVMYSGDTIRINPLICVFFNADFDGDECTLTGTTHEATAIEMDMNCSISNSGTMHQNGGPISGMFQNSLWATSKLTKSDVSMSHEIAMDMLSYVPDRVHMDPKKKIYTGREVISFVIPDKINMKRQSNYNPMYPIDYDMTEVNVEIKNGHLVSGVLDQATVGQRKHGTLFHVITNTYGPAVANRTIYSMQQLADIFISYYGATIHIGDFILPIETQQELRQQTAAVIQESLLLYDDLREGRITPPIGVTIREFFEQQQLELLQLTEHIKIVLLAINTRENNFFHLVFGCGKGNKQNMMSVMSSVGQQTIRGMRLSSDKWRGTSYFPCFSSDPVAWGFIPSSFAEGLSIPESMAMSEEVRYGLINRQLSTATTGHQNRESTKNLESLVIDPYRRVMRHKKNMVQSLYGGQGIDMRNIIYIKIGHIALSNAEFEKRYKSAPSDFGYDDSNEKVMSYLEKEFDQLKNDRANFRDRALRIEQQYMEPTIMKDVIVVPYDLENIVLSIVNENENADVKLDPIKAIKQVVVFCENLPYVFSNRFQQEKKTRIPFPHMVAVTPSLYVLRAHLCTKQLKRQNISNDMLDIILKQVFIKYKLSLADPGLAIGIIASQSLYEMYSQFMLNAHQRSGVGGTNASAKLRGIELMVARKTKSMKNPSMLLHVKPEYQYDKDKVREIASKIETLAFNVFIKDSGYIFGGEVFGSPKHVLLAKHIEYIANMKKFQDIQVPSDLSTYMIMFNLDVEQMIQKHMTMDTLIYALRAFDDKIFIVHSSEIDDPPSISCFIRTSVFGKGNAISAIESLEWSILNTIVRGIDKIVSANIKEFQRTYIDETGELKQDSIYAITTVGTNMREILTIEELDGTRCQTDSIHEMYEVFGIMAAQRKIITEMRVSFAGPAFAHYTVFASEMTYTGEITGITRAGADLRENDVLPRASYTQPIGTLSDAALNARSNPVRCASTSLILGAEIKDIGTSSCKIITDEAAITKHMKSIEDLL